MQGENSDEEDGKREPDEDDGTTDKAATPAERIHTPEELERNLEILRPQLMLAERDSDANRNVEESRANALASVSSIDMETSSSLLEQFQTEYVIGAQLVVSLLTSKKDWLGSLGLAVRNQLLPTQTTLWQQATQAGVV